jgi:hypothetical protein
MIYLIRIALYMNNAVMYKIIVLNISSLYYVAKLFIISIGYQRG